MRNAPAEGWRPGCDKWHRSPRGRSQSPAGRSSPPCGWRGRCWRSDDRKSHKRVCFELLTKNVANRCCITSCLVTHSSSSALSGVGISSRVTLKMQRAQQLLRTSAKELRPRRTRVCVFFKRQNDTIVLVTVRARAGLSLPGKMSGSSSRPPAAGPPWT